MTNKFETFQTFNKSDRSVCFGRTEVESNSTNGKFYVIVRGDGGWDQTDNQQSFTREEFDAFIEHCIWVRDGDK